ncbi:MAG: hypothetical protein NMNS01_30250 [Nitrosomonas sp.]|nr:MAG: hypothetical protein NMNS01_30250 [Nitrosomonas sp.]
MRRIVINAMLKRGFHVIGQTKKDTRLYDVPEPSRDGKAKRGEAENMARNTHPSVLNIWTVGPQH